ncbi:hypothetical protein EDL96_07110 [Kocuria soli]|uniref:Abortive infection protein-like C-terminal domain-containing protein n=1 Tax=Kocuria soli TaxID=2485125 RepID=A0A3N3ZS06_9MICC|nr:abortive infection family protein [Kocuria soli]ROZ63299.1 hypothetical protein EDL96_07110 [Kocuria soli]
MPADRYERFALPRPQFLGDDHWECISTELDRLHRSLEAEDDSQVLSDLKCLVESVARVALDLAGEPAQPNDSLDGCVKRAHTLLAEQPGHTLARGGEFSTVASQACKTARNLGNIRNQYGGGHGRARTPDIREEMVDLALDGGLTWARWAVRRLGLFSEGRPTSLIRDLIEEPATFHSGVLRRRLEAANLPALEPHHQQELGVAVGQRVMRQTFVVRRDGLDPCLESDDLAVWPAGYRIGLLRGLWFDPSGHPTIKANSIKDALSVLDPVPECADVLMEQVQRVRESTQPGLPEADQEALAETIEWLRHRVTVRPSTERLALQQLLEHLAP